MARIDSPAPYALDPLYSYGRLYFEPSDPWRNAFQRDRDRLLHASAFRRLAHKTQVFVPFEGDYHRTRLTHTLEVAQITRTIARALGLNEDLSEAIALGHDLGHPPFGHLGEEVLDECMRPFGGFNHNAQTLRIVTELENRYPKFNGLNLTWETLEGLIKHHGPHLKERGEGANNLPSSSMEKDWSENHLKDFFQAWKEGSRFPPFIARSYGSAEAQVAAVADDVAYNAHDIDDGLKAGLFDFDSLRCLPFFRPLLREIEGKHSSSLESPPCALAMEDTTIGAFSERKHYALQRHMISAFVGDVIQQAQYNLRVRPMETPEAIQQSPAPLIQLSEALREAQAQIKIFLMQHMYQPLRSENLSIVHEIISTLFYTFAALSQKGLFSGFMQKIKLPEEALFKLPRTSAPPLKDSKNAFSAQEMVKKVFPIKELSGKENSPLAYRLKELSSTGIERQHAREVCNYIAGMTDRYAFEIFRLLSQATGL